MTNFNRLEENIRTLRNLCFKYNCYVCFLNDEKSGKTSKIVIECLSRPLYCRDSDPPLIRPIESMDSPDWESIESAIIDFSLPHLFH